MLKGRLNLVICGGAFVGRINYVKGLLSQIPESYVVQLYDRHHLLTMEERQTVPLSDLEIASLLSSYNKQDGMKKPDGIRADVSVLYELNQPYLSSYFLVRNRGRERKNLSIVSCYCKSPQDLLARLVNGCIETGVCTSRMEAKTLVGGQVDVILFCVQDHAGRRIDSVLEIDPYRTDKKEFFLRTILSWGGEDTGYVLGDLPSSVLTRKIYPYLTPDEKERFSKTFIRVGG
jgi:hypothetical protein